MRAIDIFSGAGLASAGACAAGVELAGAIDLCPIATATYRDNFPGTTVENKRLEDVAPRKFRDRTGDIDLLLASPECTNHTCAKGNAERSEASRATAMQVLRYAKAYEPRWIVIENVVYMRPWTRYGELISELKGLGYQVREQVLDASEFGVAQKRRRLFVTCDRETEPPLISPPAKRRNINVQHILDPESVWRTTSLNREGRARPTLERANRAIAALGDDSAFLIVYYGTDGCGGWQRLDRPLRTITTIDRFALVTPSHEGHKMRMLQVPELKRAMGLSDDYQLNNGNRREKIRLLGNGVCPPVMEAVVSSLTADR